MQIDFKKPKKIYANQELHHRLSGQVASHELLKLAVSYRFAYAFYTGNKDVKNSEVSDTADEEEFRLIRAIVCSIVKEYNQLRKQLKMTYNENEINDGIPRLR